jgi:hypothetical protein
MFLAARSITGIPVQCPLRDFEDLLKMETLISVLEVCGSLILGS